MKIKMHHHHRAVLAIPAAAAIFLSVFAFLNSSDSLAQSELSFSEVWARVEGNTPSEKAVKNELDAAVTGAARASRHWFPVLYLDAKGYASNDPGAALFSKLSQREISAADFSPTLLNQPDAQLSERVALGVNFPLFEGGMRVAQTQIAQIQVQAKELEEKATKNAIYLEVARAYQSIAIQERATKGLHELDKLLSDVLSRYHLGSKSNPVGYSGLLGLQGLKNKIMGSHAEKRAKISAYYGAITSMASGLPEKWTPRDSELISFSQKYFTSVSGDSRAGDAPTAARLGSLKFQSMEVASQASDRMVTLEKARFLPRVGLFAESALNHGDRGTGVSHTAGAYLQFNLFSASDYGAVHQAQSSSLAAHDRIDEAKLHETIEVLANREATKALEEGLRLLGDSSRLLAEQTEVAKKLFNSGAMNALQFAEVLNRRTDLLSALENAEIEYLNAQVVLSDHSGHSRIIQNKNGESHD